MGLYIDEKLLCMNSGTMSPKQVGIQWTRIVALNATIHAEPYPEARSVFLSTLVSTAWRQAYERSISDVRRSLTSNFAPS